MTKAETPKNGTPQMGENTQQIAPAEAMEKLELLPRVIARRSFACEIGDPGSPVYRDTGYWEKKNFCDDQGMLQEPETFMKNVNEDPELAYICAWAEEMAVEAFQAGIKFMIPALQEAQAAHLPSQEV